jgi:HK97 family phage prohead protease
MAETLTRSATFSPDTFNAEAGTVEAVISTFAPVTRRDGKGAFTERLDPARLDTSGLIGAPVLDGHRQGSARDVIGVVVAFRMEGANLVATIRLSSAPDVASIITRIREGTIRGVSIGYRVTLWEDSFDPITKARVRTAAAWSISEVSAVPVPADPGATFRSEKPMPTETETINREDLIETLTRACGLPDTWAADLAEDLDEDGIRKAALAEMQKRQAPRVRVTREHSDPATITRRKADALAFRMAGGTLPDDAREFVNMGFKELAADALTRAGESVRSLSTDEILTRAGQHTTSDFPLVVSNAMNKVALATYQAAESPLKQLSKQRTLADFKDSTSIRLGELGTLADLSESGEFTATTRAESGEVMRLTTKGVRVDVSRKLLIDDDANLLGDMTAALGQAGAQTEANVMVNLIVGNPALRDGTTVFHASRGNIGTAAALSVTSLGAARQALRQRKGLDGVTPISATPAFLLVGPELETLAEQVLSSIYAADVSDVNPFAGKLRLLVEPRITGNDWWVFADPARLATLQHAYLSSAQGVQIQRQEAWNTLGLSFRAFLDFGAGWVDWRGAQYNAGA